MKQEIARLEGEVEQLIAQAEAVDTEEDTCYGVGNRGDQLPEKLRNRQQRLARIRQANAALEARAQQEQSSENDGGDDRPVGTADQLQRVYRQLLSP